MFMGNPVKSTGGWDTGIMTTEKVRAGPHMLCDEDGNGLGWNEVYDNMIVKIRAANTNWPGYEYLYRSNMGK